MNKTERNPENAFFFEQNKKSSGKAEGFLWWRRPDLNRLPRQCECRALPGELRPHNRSNCITNIFVLQVNFVVFSPKDIYL